MAETALDRQVAFAVISDLRGDERLLSAALSEIPGRVLTFTRKKRISRGKEWSGLDKMVLIGNSPGLQFDEGRMIDIAGPWSHLQGELDKFRRMGLFGNGRIPQQVSEYGPAALASWLSENGRTDMDKQVSDHFLKYVGYKDWRTGIWDQARDGIATRNYRKFWRNVAKAVSSARFHVRIMPTDRIYFEEVPPTYDLAWEPRVLNNVKFGSMPIGRIQNKHFVQPLAAGPRDRAGITYDYKLFSPMDPDVLIGYLYTPDLDALLTADEARRAEAQQQPRERLMIFTYDLNLKPEGHIRRASAHPGTVIVEEVKNTISAYVLHGAQAWRIQLKWDPAKAKFVDQGEEPIKFAKPHLTPTALTPELTEEAAALQLLSAPERFKLFLAELKNLNPAAAEDLKDKQVDTFEALAQLQSGYHNKMQELETKLLQEHELTEKFCAKLFEVMGCANVYSDIKEALWKKYSVDGQKVPDAAHDALLREGTAASLDRVKMLMDALDREKKQPLEILSDVSRCIALGTHYEKVVGEVRNEFNLGPEAPISGQALDALTERLLAKAVEDRDRHIDILKKAQQKILELTDNYAKATERVSNLEEKAMDLEKYGARLVLSMIKPIGEAYRIMPMADSLKVQGFTPPDESEFYKKLLGIGGAEHGTKLVKLAKEVVTTQIDLADIHTDVLSWFMPYEDQVRCLVLDEIITLRDSLLKAYSVSLKNHEERLGERKLWEDERGKLDKQIAEVKSQMDALSREKSSAVDALSKELAEQRELVEHLNRELRNYEGQLLGDDDAARQKVIDDRAREFAKSKVGELERQIGDLERQNASLALQLERANKAYCEIRDGKEFDVESARKSETQYRLRAQNAYGEARKEFEQQLADKDKRIGELEAILKSQGENHKKAVALTKSAERLCGKKPGEAADIYRRAYDIAPHEATKAEIAFNVGFALYKLAEGGSSEAYAEAIPWFEKAAQDEEAKEFLSYCRAKIVKKPASKNGK